jgi:hypothetical protein
MKNDDCREAVRHLREAARHGVLLGKEVMRISRLAAGRLTERVGRGVSFAVEIGPVAEKDKDGKIFYGVTLRSKVLCKACRDDGEGGT